MMPDNGGMFAPLSDAERANAKKAKPGKRAEKTPIIPVPADAPPMKFRHPQHGEPSKVWRYDDAEGRLVGYVCRWNFTNNEGLPDKEVLPVTFCDIGNGRRDWRSKGIPAPRPLFGLPDLIARADAMVLVAEGEKSRDAAAVLFPECVATTPPHGAKSPHLADFSPLAGRVVVVATDHDPAGRAFGDKVCELARDAGAADVLHLAPERLGAWVWRDGAKVRREGALPEGFDIADALADGWTAERVAEAAKATPLFLPYFTDNERQLTDEDDDAPAPTRSGAFRVSATGVEKRIERKDEETGETKVEFRWICSHLEVVAETRNADGEEWGRLLRLTDRDDRVKDWAMPMSLLAGDGATYRERLLSLGMTIAPGRFARDGLHDYISTATPPTKARCVSRIGWHGKAFVLPDTVFGDTAGETTLLQTEGGADHAFKVRGTLANWQAGLARYAVGNSRLALSIAAAFAAPLLHLAAAESGGFHLRGASSTGKSTALIAAGSVWGGGGLKGYVRQWRATDNGLETIAVGHCDSLLCLDELSQIAPEAAGAAAYMLGNGQGKSRAGRSGEGRAAAEWRTLFLSSGEISIADKIAEAGRGRRMAAGQSVRVVDIAADAGAGLGLFEYLHDFPSADALARHLKAAAADNYGVAARSFLEALTKDTEGAAETLAKFRGDFLTAHAPASADGQVFRVASRFALVAAAGEMAAAFGVLPWPAGEATSAAAACFAAWLADRGGSGSAEEMSGVAAVRRFIEAHGASRFEPMGALIPTDVHGAPLDVRIHNRAGFRRLNDAGDVEYLVLPEAFRAEVCAGLDATATAKALAARGFLVPGSGGKLSSPARVPGFSGPVRVYRVTADILSDG